MPKVDTNIFVKDQKGIDIDVDVQGTISPTGGYYATMAIDGASVTVFLWSPLQIEAFGTALEDLGHKLLMDAMKVKRGE